MIIPGRNIGFQLVSAVKFIRPGLVPDTSPTLTFEYDKIIESVKFGHRCLNGVYKINMDLCLNSARGVFMGPGGHMGPVLSPLTVHNLYMI